jgi:hypothetical protein
VGSSTGYLDEGNVRWIALLIFVVPPTLDFPRCVDGTAMFTTGGELGERAARRCALPVFVGAPTLKRPRFIDAAGVIFACREMVEDLTIFLDQLVHLCITTSSRKEYERCTKDPPQPRTSID